MKDFTKMEREREREQERKPMNQPNGNKLQIMSACLQLCCNYY